MPSIVAAGFIIFRRPPGKDRPIQYLLLQASYRKHHWSPPKGCVDFGETEMEAAVRETEEESGYKRDDYRIVKGFQRTLHYIRGGRPKRLEYWLAELKDPDRPVKLSIEHKDYKWLELEEAQKCAYHRPEFQAALADAEELILKQ